MNTSGERLEQPAFYREYFEGFGALAKQYGVRDDNPRDPNLEPGHDGSTKPDGSPAFGYCYKDTIMVAVLEGRFESVDVPGSIGDFAEMVRLKMQPERPDADELDKLGFLLAELEKLNPPT